MRRYKYRAKDKNTGKIVTGNVQAENERAAGKILVEQGYVPEKLSDTTDGGFLSKFTNRVSSKQRIIYASVCDSDWCRFAAFDGFENVG